ncbi:MAG TPA: signal peptidase II [Patescibacteria group bacterium]|nr:signal peptidase II [Patescibacteria group bacterium]
MADGQMTKRTESRVAETEFRTDSVIIPPKGKPRLWFAAATLAFLLDRLLKTAAIARGVDPSPGAIAFTLFRNTGIAFSLPLPSGIFWPAAAAIFAVLAWLFVRSLPKDKMRAGMLAMIILGAASNLIDRYMYGSTTDYLLFFGRSAINVADAMIVVGLAALFGHAAKQDKPAVHATQ